jgi:HAE1 family hydrophobic/amphiphilic exporter-1
VFKPILSSTLVTIIVFLFLNNVEPNAGTTVIDTNNDANKLKVIANANGLNNWSLNHKWIVIIISIVLLVGSIGLGAAKLGTSYITNTAY